MCCGGYNLLGRRDRLAHAVGQTLLAAPPPRVSTLDLRDGGTCLCVRAIALEGVAWTLPDRTASWVDLAAGGVRAAAGLTGMQRASRLRAARAHMADLHEKG